MSPFGHAQPELMPGTQTPPDSLPELPVSEPEPLLDSVPVPEPSTGVLPQAGRAVIRKIESEVQERPVMRGTVPERGAGSRDANNPLRRPGFGRGRGSACGGAQKTCVMMSSAPRAAGSTFSSQSGMPQTLVTSPRSTMRGRLMHFQPPLKVALPSRA